MCAVVCQPDVPSSEDTCQNHVLFVQCLHLCLFSFRSGPWAVSFWLLLSIKLHGEVEVM